MFLCGKKKIKSLTDEDFRGKGIISYIEPNEFYDIICYKCNGQTNINNYNIKLARIMKEHYYFCSEDCWSKWCSNFNRFK